MKLFGTLLLSAASYSTSLAVASTSSQGVHVPVGKDGEGEYTAATKGCFDVIDAATPQILAQIQTQPLRTDGSGAYHIADYGTADAGTSLGLLTKMVQSVRDKIGDDSKEVVIHYEDQLTNEWQSVFNHFLGNKRVQDAYGNDVPTPFGLGNVFSEASGVGFHSQCYPSNSIDYGLSFTAMHWLSAFPSSLRGQRPMHAARCETRPAPEKQQAAEDWLAILKARSKELVPGGQFCCVNFCVSKDGYFLGQTDVGASMWDSFDKSWRKLHEDGVIDDDELDGVSFPSYYRTSDEFMEGIEQCDDLKVVSMEEKVVRCPYRELWTAKKTGDMSPEDYAKWFVPTTRTWSHSTFKSGLRSDRSDIEKEAILKQFWSNYMDLVAEDPSAHGMDYVHSYIVLEKK